MRSWPYACCTQPSASTSRADRLMPRLDPDQLIVVLLIGLALMGLTAWRFYFLF